jgi:hypothetical protein
MDLLFEADGRIQIHPTHVPHEWAKMNRWGAPSYHIHGTRKVTCLPNDVWKEMVAPVKKPDFSNLAVST